MKIFKITGEFFLAVLKRTAFSFLDLMKIIVPVYTMMTILSYTPVIKFLADWLKPAMKIFGLPGESALALILGNFINLYAAIGVIPLLHLTPWQTTTIALMLLTSHSQLLETSVFFKLKTRAIFLLILRLSVAIMVGLLLALR
ncbi:MAG: nucleoside recognition protein [candidate division WOR-3 bacterium]|nr:nucleoside recognition protein [candidate division WOR-3 bacterium]